MIKRKNFGVVGTLALAITLLLILQMTTPATIGPLGILAVFVLMYLLMLSGCTFLLYAGSKVLARLAGLGNKQMKVREQLSLTQAYYYSSVIALAPVMLIGMQSVGGINFYGVILVLVFVAVACTYVAKRSR